MRGEVKMPNLNPPPHTTPASWLAKTSFDSLARSTGASTPPLSSASSLSLSSTTSPTSLRSSVDGLIPVTAFRRPPRHLRPPPPRLNRDALNTDVAPPAIPTAPLDKRVTVEPTSPVFYDAPTSPVCVVSPPHITARLPEGFQILTPEMFGTPATIASRSALSRARSKSNRMTEAMQGKDRQNRTRSSSTAVEDAASPSTLVKARQNFRPLRHETQAQLDAFFGMTAAQKAETHLRTKDEEGKVWYDPIEREEWRHLLAPVTPGGSPQASQGGRRRSSAFSNNATLYNVALAEANSSLTPTLAEFTLASGAQEAEDEAYAPRRNRLKRSISAAALAKIVADRLPQDSGNTWVSVATFKRRASSSTGVDIPYEHVTSQDREAEQLPYEGQIHISRLPLEHRKATKELLDEAFPIVAPNVLVRPHRPIPLELTAASTPAAATSKQARRHSSHGEMTPSTASSSSLASPHRRLSSPITPSVQFADLALPPPQSRRVVKKASRARRNTFGTLYLEDGKAAEADTEESLPSADSGFSSSSRGMEMLASPFTVAPDEEQLMQSQHRRRFGMMPSAKPATGGSRLARVASRDTLAEGSESESEAVAATLSPDDFVSTHLRVRSSRRERKQSGNAMAVDEHTLPRKASCSSLASCRTTSFPVLAQRSASRCDDLSSETADASRPRHRPTTSSVSSLASSSFSSLSSQYNRPAGGAAGGGLTPRQAHRKRAVTPPPIPSPPMSPVISKPTLSILQEQVDLPPLLIPSSDPFERYKVSAGLETGSHVYDGVDIPCPAVHLASDAEDDDDADDKASRSSVSVRTGGKADGKKPKSVKRWLAKVVK